MTSDFDDYVRIASGEFRLPSSFATSLPAWGRVPDASDVIPILEQHGCTGIVPGEGDAGWSLRFDQGTLSVAPSEEITKWHVGPGRPGENTLAEMAQSNESLVLEWTLGDPVLESFHEVVRLLHALAPEAVGLLDRAACRAHSSDWVRSVAESRTPPPPISLYSLHAVLGDDGLGWIHSHGLLRCGAIELEMLDVEREHASAMSTLINTAAMLFLEQGTCPPQEPFFVGRDMELLWLPWQGVMTERPASALGGMEDRSDCHDHPSGVLFAPKKKRLGLFGKSRQSPAIHAELLAGDPLLYHSSMETRRMSMLAKEHFAELRRLENRFRGSEDWSFLVKLGYSTDDDPDQGEHMWFQVHAIDGAEIDATLLNQPFGIARMHQGDRDKHPLDPVSDWMIHCPHGVFRPDNVRELEELLAEA